MLLLLLLYAIFAAMAFINSAIMLSNPYPFLIGMLRAWASAIIMGVMALWWHPQELKKMIQHRINWNYLLGFAVCVHGLVMFGFSFCVLYIDPIKVCFIFSTCPFITAILQYYFGEEKITTKKILGLIIGFAGLAPILLGAETGAYKDIPVYLEIIGSIVCFLLIFIFAYGWICMKKFLKTNSYPLMVVNFYAMFIGGILSCLLFLLYHGFKGFFLLKVTPSFYPLTIAFVLSSLLTYIIYPYLLKTYSATFVAFAGFLEPVFGVLYGWLLFGQVITIQMVVCLGILFLGLYIFYQEESNQDLYS